jgi:XRE family transcriptional regulator, regulator of sulfur utilization
VPPLSPRHRALGHAVRALREARDLSQETLADQAELSANYIGDTERGERNISVRALWQIADGLNVSASELLHEAEKKRSGRKAKR